MQAVPHLDVSPNIHLEDEAIDLRQYLSIISNYKWSILGLTFVVTLLTTLYTYTIVPTYTSAATILIEAEEENIISIEEVYGISSRYYEYFETQLQIIKSRDLAEHVIDNLKLANHPEFDPNFKQPDSNSRFGWKGWNPVNWFSEKKENAESVPLSGLNLRNALVANFFGRLTVKLVPDTHLISIRFDAYDPKLTAQVPNELAKVYINSGLEAHLESTRKASEWITNQLDDLKQKVDDSERALQKFLDEEQLVDAQGVNSLAVKQLDDISEKLVEARRNRSEIEELYRQITALRGQPIERYESIPAVLKDPMVHQSKTIQAEAERKVSELSKRYGHKHPKMLAAKAELATAKESVKAQILNVVDSVKKEYSVAMAEESHLAGAMKSTKGEISLINRKGNELKTLEKEVESNRQLYDMFLTRFKETSATDDLQSANARIIDLAVIPSAPYKPNRPRIIMIAMILGMIISIGIIFFIEALDNTLKDSADVENKLFIPTLSILPKLNIWLNKDIKAMRYFSDKKHSSFSENIRTIRTGVLLNDVDEPHKSILVTSSVPEEGKSIVAVNLSLALGQMGKVLLIDADMRKPSIAKVFGLNNNHPGLSHFIAGTHDLQQCVHHFEQEKVYVMPAGHIPSNPLELLSSNRFKTGLKALMQSFDHVVIDSAPAVPVSDPIVLSRLVSATVYVVKADDTPYQLAKAGVKKLQQVDANIVGVVLNQVNPSKRPGRYGYAESDYYSYYGYNKS